MKNLNASVRDGILSLKCPTELHKGGTLIVSRKGGETISTLINVTEVSLAKAYGTLSFDVSDSLPDGPYVITIQKKKEKIPGDKGYPSKLSQYADRTATPAKLPVDSKEHTRAAISYFSKTKLEGASKKEVAKRILSAAKKFGIHVGKDSDVYKAAK